MFIFSVLTAFSFEFSLSCQVKSVYFRSFDEFFPQFQIFPLNQILFIFSDVTSFYQFLISYVAITSGSSEYSPWRDAEFQRMRQCDDIKMELENLGSCCTKRISGLILLLRDPYDDDQLRPSQNPCSISADLSRRSYW